jgi:tetratricopeptide (TPR) repeat protein
VNLYQRGPWYSFPLGFWVLSPFTTLFAGVGIAQIILRRNSLTAIFADAWQRRGTVAIALFVPAVLAVATFLPGFKSLRFVSVVVVPICLVGGFLISHLLAEARTRFAPAVFHCVLCVVTIVVALVCISDYRRFQRIFVHYELDDVTVPRVVNFAFAADSGWDKARAETFDNSNFPEYQLLRSLVLYDQGRYAEAIKACQAALNLKPDYAEAWNNIGAAYNKLGRYEEAAAACERALRYKPDFDLARNNLQYAREQLKASAK